jgi:23S rRNA (cytosine1962-C5)-methyltransferase
MNRDASFYLDTRNLRQWLIENMHEKTVLNTFAYTGSLGVAALAGGATRVVQHDLNRQFLNVAKTSYTLNGLPIHREDFIAADFFSFAARRNRTGETFDCVIIDPPFFSSTSKGKVDQVHESARLINKVRPLINNDGILIAINNALYVSGKKYMQTLETICKDGYLSIRGLIPVPEDFIGYHPVREPITDPSPFNHSTKIAILDVKRK